MEKKDIEFLEKFSHDVYKIETSKDDYFRFVELTLKYVELEEFLNTIVQDLLLEETIQEWKDNNTKYSSDKFVDFVAGLLFEAKSKNSSLRDGFSDVLDNYSLVTKNVCSIIHYLITHYLNRFSFSQILVTALCVNLHSYRIAGKISVGDIKNMLYVALKNNVFHVGKEERNFNDNWNEQALEFVSCLSRVSIVALSLLLPFDCGDISHIKIANTLDSKANEIKDFVKKLFDDPLSFKDDVLWRTGADNLIENDKDIKENVHSYTGDFLIDLSDVDDICDFEFIDFDEDFDGDGFGVYEVSSFCRSVDDRADHKKEHDEYLIYLDQKRQVMKESYRESFPELNKKTIKQYEVDKDDANSQAIAGISYLFGIFTGRDFEKAFRFFERGAALGSPECTYQLSVMYLKGIFVEFVLEKWVFYLNKACILGNKDAINQWNTIKAAYTAESNYENEQTKELLGKFRDTFKGFFPNHYKVTHIEGIISDAKQQDTRELYFEISNKILSNYIKYDENYLENIKTLFGSYEYIDQRLTVYKLLKRAKKEGINAEIAYEIGNAIGKMIPRYPRSGEFNLHISHATKTNELGPKICWYILAYDLGKKNIELELLKHYEHAHLKNIFSDDLFYKIICDKKSFELFRVYKPAKKELLIRLVKSGFTKANGYLMAILYGEGNINEARKCAADFLSVATDEDITGLINDINKSINPELSYRTNYQKYLMKKSKTLKEISIANKSSGCYVATCIYGSYNCPQVWRLRRYRDSYLRKSILGRTFIRIYYDISPLLVKLFGNKNWFKIPIKKILDKMIFELSRKGYSDEPYVD